MALVSAGGGHTCGLEPAVLADHLLGGLAPLDDLHVRQAGRSCLGCATELPALRRVAAALAQVAAEDVDERAPAAAAQAVPPGALEHLLRRVDGERRRATRRRTLLAAAALAVGLAAGSVGAVVLRGGDGDDVARPGGPRTTVSFPAREGAAGRAVVVGTAAGSRVVLDVSGLDPGVLYGAWLAAADGTRTPAGSFRADARGAARVELSAGLAPQDARTAGVTRLGGDDVLVATVG